MSESKHTPGLWHVRDEWRVQERGARRDGRLDAAESFDERADKLEAEVIRRQWREGA